MTNTLHDDAEDTAAPKSFWLNITDHCNNKCLWCYEKNNDIKAKCIGLEDAFEIILSMKKVGAEDCIILGGEPTLHPNLFEIIKFVKSSEMRAILVSNGRRLHDAQYVNDLCASGIDAVNISIHGWDEQSYKECTNSSTGFLQLTKAINNLLENNVNLGTTLVLSTYVENKLESAIEAISQMGVEFLEFNMGAPAVSEANIDGSYVIPMNRQREIVMSAYHLCMRKGIKPGFNLTIPHCLFSKSELKELLKNARVASGCSMKNGSGIVFKVDGSITTCNHFLDFSAADKQTVIDELRNGTFLNFWNNQEFTELRENVSNYNSKACAECEHWESCGGGCPINWMYFDPEKENLRPISI